MDVAKSALACTLLIALSGSAFGQMQGGDAWSFPADGGYVDGPINYGAPYGGGAGGTPAPRDFLRSHAAHFYGTIDGMFLRYRPSTDVPLGISPGGTVLVSTDQEIFDYEAAAEGTVGLRLPNGGAIEGSYLYVDEWDAYNSPLPPSTINPAVSGFTPAQIAVSNYFGAVTYRTYYEADIEQTEVNYLTTPLSLIGPWVGVQGIIGARYVELDELLQVTGVNATGASTSSWQAENRMFGGSSGLRVRGVFDLFSIDFTGKVGVFHNEMDQAQQIRDVNNTVIVRNLASDDDGEAFVGEISLIGQYQINGSLAVRGGYMATVYDHVATAPAQIDFNLADGPNTLNNSETVLIHGFVLGLYGAF